MADDEKGPSRLILLQVPHETLMQDLKSFKEKALELGASMAEIIPADWVEIDERVRLKCIVPMCPHYGKSAFCPPNAPDTDFMRRALSRYQWAIVFALDVLPVSEFSDRDVQRKAGVQWTKRNIEITGRLETTAFGNGYYLAMGFCQSSCNATLCASEKCQVLQGNKCAHPLKARPSMEGIGIDVYRLVRKVGWEMYPIYRSVDPTTVPQALAVGIVFIL
jgi:predicted metal-binding protein